jgi:uncharacterized protein YndB with AHSA1/START domain
MSSNSENEIYSSREVKAPVEMLYQAFANPIHLKKWWGPEGFTNTIHEFDLRPEGKWILTMHGPEKGNYENSSVFKIVEPNKLIRWTRKSQPLFDMEVGFEKIQDTQSRISFRMIFTTVEECNKLKSFVVPNNEENFDRLERELVDMIRSASPFAQTYFHGTKADLKPGDFIEVGNNSNFGQRKNAKYIFLTATLDAAIWGAELAIGEGTGRIYLVEPTGPIEDDPDLTDKKFPGNPTKSYRSTSPFKIVGEVTHWQGHPPEQVEAMKDALVQLKEQGINSINDN